MMRKTVLILAASILVSAGVAPARDLEPVQVDGQPLSVNVGRLVQAMQFLGAPLPQATRDAIKAAANDAKKLQAAVDPQVLLVVRLDAPSGITASKGPATIALQQGAYTPAIVKIVNPGELRPSWVKQLGRRQRPRPGQFIRIASPKAGNVFSGGRARGPGSTDRFLDLEMVDRQPMTRRLSGVKAEYAVVLIYSTEAGKKEVALGAEFVPGKSGFSAPIAFDIRPGIKVTLRVKDFDGKPSTGRFTFQDTSGRIHPPLAKRLAPDFFFQQQIYRHDGGTVLLPPGKLAMSVSRGPEYRQKTRTVTIPEKGEHTIEVQLERWVNAKDYGLYSGDHHIHAAGCAHYSSPTEGVHAPDMFLHVKGEGLNVGCNLTWGPCYDYQRKFFSAEADKVSEPFTVLKYDVEVSGFGSQLLGHVDLLNLRDQTYPGSEGTKTKGWPTWTTPLMKWAKAQGATTGYAHSAIGLRVNPQRAAQRLIRDLDADKDRQISKEEAAKGLIPDSFAKLDADGNGTLSQRELIGRIAQISNRLPNYAVPEMNGIGAQEICVTVAQGICDFISAMDTARVPEWNCWYHIMNCGYPLKVSGESDFPCISGSRVGMGRVYVDLGKIEKINYARWCKGLAEGRSYVSDGYAHALEFSVNGKKWGGQVDLAEAGSVKVKAKVAFASETPLGTSNGGRVPEGKDRRVELIVNGRAVATRIVPADDKTHDLEFDLKIDRSSWVALRHFPQMHSNPVSVLVGGKPIRASRRSALWCINVIEQLWAVRARVIAEHERAEAEKTFQWAIEQYKKIAAECPEGS